jgi:vacuolar iron transporter family protein
MPEVTAGMALLDPPIDSQVPAVRLERVPGDAGAAAGVGTGTRSRIFERAAVREILMGAQDNLTNVLAVMLGVAIGAGRSELVALAGVSAAIAEAVSMGGVLYSSTRAEDRAAQRSGVGPGERHGLAPFQSGALCFAAAIAAGLIPLLPFLFLPLRDAVVAAVLVSLTALFLLGSWTGRIGGATWWRDGLRLVVVASLAAIASAVAGTLLRVA